MFSLESPQRGDSNEYTQYTISQYKKENHPNLYQIRSYGISSKGPENEFEAAVVNEPSVFEPLKFYCMYICCGSSVLPFLEYACLCLLTMWSLCVALRFAFCFVEKYAL